MTKTAKPTITIKDVKCLSRGVKILFTDDTSLFISNQAYTEGFYYPDKELTHEEYQTLKKADKSRKAEEYLNSLLSSSRHTHKQISDRLQTKFSLSYKEIEIMLLPYVQSGLIDDKAYALDYLEVKVAAGYGKNYLESELKRRGVPATVLKDDEVQAMYPIAEDSLEDLIQRQNRLKKNLTLSQRKEKIFAFLLRRGFDSGRSKDAIEKYYSSLSSEEKDEESENHCRLLRKEAEKCYNLISRKNTDGKKKKDAFIRKLLAKGFQYEEISALINEKEYQFHD